MIQAIVIDYAPNRKSDDDVDHQGPDLLALEKEYGPLDDGSRNNSPGNQRVSLVSV